MEFNRRVKAKLPAENADKWWLQQKMSRLMQRIFIKSLKVFKLLSMCTKFQVNK